MRGFVVRSVTTDGSGHAITETDVMSEAGLVQTLGLVSAIYNGRVSEHSFGRYTRRTFEQVLSDGRRVTDMIISNEIEEI